MGAASAGSIGSPRRRRPSPIGLAVELLIAVSAPNEPMTVRELSRHLGWPRSSVHRALAILESYGLLVQDQASQLYQLGPRVLSLASSFLSRNDLVSSGAPVIGKLRDRLDETSSLQVRVGTRRVPIAIAECSHELRHVLRVGSSYPLFAGSAGKALVAFGDDPGLSAAVLDDARQHPEEVTFQFDSTHYLDELALIRRQGYATSRDERVQGSVGIAAPVFNSRGELLCALTVHGPTVRMNRQALDRAIPSVLETAQSLSAIAANQSPTTGNHSAHQAAVRPPLADQSVTEYAQLGTRGEVTHQRRSRRKEVESKESC